MTRIAMSAESVRDQTVPSVARVREARAEIAAVTTLTLALEDQRSAPAWAPGQFAMLYAFGVGEAAISFSGDPADPETHTHTVRHAGAVSTALGSLRRGEALGVRGPFGRGWPTTDIEGRHLIVMAGGLGLAPLRPVILAAMHGSVRPQRLSILCGAREPERVLFSRELTDWRKHGAEVFLTVDHAGSDWTGDVGLVTDLIRRMDGASAATVAFVCGPEVMMRFSACALTDAGVAAERIWLSMERTMKCAVGHCGRCQFGGDFVCTDGPVFRFDRVRTRLFTPEL